MPKDNSERIIDWPYSPTKSRSGTVSSGGGGGGGGGGATNLDALTDVTVAAPSNGQVLTYESASGQWKNSAAGSGGVPNPHGLSSSYHSGLLSWALVDKTGSNLADIVTRPHSALTGIGPNDHHDQQHAIVSSDHTASGLTTGNTIRATGPTTFAWAQLQHTDLGNVLPDQHHFRAHNITTGDAGGQVHTITGSQFDVVGATGTNVLGLLTPSPNPGAAAAILRTYPNGSLQLDTDLLYVDAPNNRIGINVVTGPGPLGGAAALDIRAGATGDITQRIRQISGQTQRLWRVEDVSGNELIVLDAVGNLQSGQPGFVSGLTGWQISHNGNAEFNNIWARGELHATVFVKDEVHATGGTLLIATAGKMHSDATIDSSSSDLEELEIVSSVPGVTGPLTIVTTSGTFAGTTLFTRSIQNYIEIDDPPSGAGFYFTAGEVIRAKTEVPTGVTDFWLEVKNPKQFTGYSRYSVIKRSGTDGLLPKGSAMVSYGFPGYGRILLTSDWQTNKGHTPQLTADASYAPYIDIFTVGPNVWEQVAGSVIPRVRLGQLQGVGLPGVSGVSQFGLIAGTDLSNANSPYFIASNLQFKLYKINITLNDGTNDTAQINQNGSLTLGKNIGVSTGKGFQVINGTGTTQDGNVLIGQKPGNYVEWDQNSGVLTVVGAIAVAGGGASTTYVDAGDTAAKAYSGKRIVNAVGGAWTVTGAAAVTWTGAFVNLGGIVYNINPTSGSGSLTGLSTSAASYLYVDVSTTAPFTLLATTNGGLLTVDMVVVAVFMPPPAGGTMGTITLMGGTTYISGGNIITNTILADHLTTGSVTAGKIWANNTVGLGVVGYINGNNKTYGSGSGFFLGYDSSGTAGYKFDIGDTTNFLRWSSATGLLIQGTAANVIVGNPGYIASAGGKGFGNGVAGFFLGYDPFNTPAPGYKFDVGNATNYMRWDGSSLTIAGVVIAGAISVAAGGYISSGKTYNSSTAGFFQGYDATAPAGYKYDLGDGTNYIRWDGTQLNIAARLISVVNTSGHLMVLQTGSNFVQVDVAASTYSGGLGAMVLNQPLEVHDGSNNLYVRSTKFIQEGSTFQIRASRTIASFGNTGLVGEICWDANFLYVCVANNNWRRIAWTSSSW